MPKCFNKRNITCTFVIPTRNDGYGGSSPETLACNINYLINGVKDSEHGFEIIVVEWNRFDGAASLAVSLNGKITTAHNVTVRVFSVPAILHQKFRYWYLHPYCQHGAINFGLRRARGKFCIVKMQDTVYSTELLEWFARADFNEMFVYRADRIVVSKDLFVGHSVFGRNEYSLFENGYRDLPLTRSGLHTNASGDFMLMSTASWLKIRGEGDSATVRMYGPDGLTLAKAVGSGLVEHRLSSSMVVFKPKHENMYSARNAKQKPKCVTSDLLFQLTAFPKKIGVIRWIGRLSRFFIFAALNLPKNYDGDIPIDSIYRYFVKYELRLRFAKYIKFGSKDWGFPDFEAGPIELTNHGH